MKKRQWLLLAGMLGGVVILFSILLQINIHSPKLALENADIVFTGDIENRLYLLDGEWAETESDGEYAQTVTINVPDPSGSCLYFPGIGTGKLYVNGQLLSSYTSDAYILYDLEKHPAENNTWNIVFVPDATIYPLAIPHLYIGSAVQILSISQFGVAQRLFIIGLSTAAVLYSLSLFFKKKSERYLLLLTLLAFSTAGRTSLNAFPEIDNLFPLNVVFFGTFPIPGAGPAFSTIVNSLMLLLLVGFLSCCLFDVFIDVKIGTWPYFRYVIIAAVITLPLLISLKWYYYVLTFLYLLTYSMELFIIIRSFSNPGNEGLIFAVAWVLTVTFRLFFITSELGLILQGNANIHLKLGGVIVTFNTLAFAFMINRRFASKFSEADDLSHKLARINANLEDLVNERTNELKSAYEQQKEQQLRKVELLTNIVHNIKTPLFSLTGYTDMIRANLGNNSDKIPSYLTQIDQNVDYVHRMSEDLLLFTRLEDKSVEFHFSIFSMADMLEQIRQTTEYYASQRGLQIVLAETAIVEMEGDSHYLRQAIQNIVDNAIHHSPQNGQVSLAFIVRQESLILQIADNGFGIDPQDMPHIFERYYSRQRERRSSGLGLTIAKNIIETHGGNISVESVPGKGSCFTITLPLRQHSQD